MSKFSENLNQLKQIRAQFEILDNKFKEIKGYEGPVECCKPDDVTILKDDVKYLYALISNMRNYLYQLEGAFYNYTYEHNSNHVPKLNASAMEKFLKAVGMDDDFEVQKPTIYMTASKHGAVVNANYIKK
jgi:hypothetical protein